MMQDNDSRICFKHLYTVKLALTVTSLFRSLSGPPVDFYVINQLQLTVTSFTRPTARKICPNVKIPILMVTNFFFCPLADSIRD